MSATANQQQDFSPLPSDGNVILSFLALIPLLPCYLVEHALLYVVPCWKGLVQVIDDVAECILTIVDPSFYAWTGHHLAREAEGSGERSGAGEDDEPAELEGDEPEQETTQEPGSVNARLVRIEQRLQFIEQNTFVDQPKSTCETTCDRRHGAAEGMLESMDEQLNSHAEKLDHLADARQGLEYACDTMSGFHKHIPGRFQKLEDRVSALDQVATQGGRYERTVSGDDTEMSSVDPESLAGDNYEETTGDTDDLNKAEEETAAAIGEEGFDFVEPVLEGMEEEPRGKIR